MSCGCPVNVISAVTDGVNSGFADGVAAGW